MVRRCCWIVDIGTISMRATAFRFQDRGPRVAAYRDRPRNRFLPAGKRLRPIFLFAQGDLLVARDIVLCGDREKRGPGTKFTPAKYRS